jgi:dUTP pyrophosphatase
MFLVKKLNPEAIIPDRKTFGSAGYDISSLIDHTIPVGSSKLIDTGLAFTVPNGTYGQLAPRSGLSCKGIFVNAGVIDRDYTGHVKVLLFNFGNEDFEIKKGDRIAQLIIKKIETPEITEVDELDLTERGENGFGSSG